MDCLHENYCKRADCKTPSNFDPDAYLAKANKTLPRKHALPDEEPARGLTPAEYRELTEAAADDCQRPPTSDWEGRGLLAAGVVVVPWAAVMLWLLILAMIRSAARAARDHK